MFLKSLFCSSHIENMHDDSEVNQMQAKKTPIQVKVPLLYLIVHSVFIWNFASYEKSRYWGPLNWHKIIAKNSIVKEQWQYKYEVN